jgi:hypothetical protein
VRRSKCSWRWIEFFDARALGPIKNNSGVDGWLRAARGAELKKAIFCHLESRAVVVCCVSEFISTGLFLFTDLGGEDGVRLFRSIATLSGRGETIYTPF